MNTPNDGGPAFPINDTVYPNGQVQPGYNGMSLRDWLAGQALAGQLAHGRGKDGASRETIAGFSYWMADAMLAARKGGGTP